MASRAEVTTFVACPDRGVHKLPLALVLFGSIAFRWPRLWNAGDLHSDSAVVGLQAMHFLRGEWSPFLWGSGYQTSVDSAVAALFFLVLGPTPLALRLSTFLGFVALTLLAYGTLRRHVSAAAAAMLVAPLVLTPSPVHTYVFSPPRQAALTLAFLAIYLFDGVRQSPRPIVGLSTAGAALGFACFADPYAFLFVLPALFVAVPAVLDGERSARSARGVGAALGAALGLAPFMVVFERTDATHGVFALTSRMLERNWDLLTRQCLPFLLSVKVFAPHGDGAWSVWSAPRWFEIVQIAGAIGFVGAIIGGGILAIARRVDAHDRRLGLLGASMLPLAVAAFLFSVMPVDLFSARYLVGIILTAPFALLPISRTIGSPRLAALLSPYLLASAVAGWLGYGSEGSHPFRRSAVAVDDDRLFEELTRRGIHYGIADYWASYRMAFLSREDFIVAPWHASQDRYGPYRASVAGARAVAYVYDPLESLESLEERRTLFASGDTEYAAEFETLRIGRYTVFVLRRDPSRTNAPRPVFGRTAS